MIQECTLCDKKFNKQEEKLVFFTVASHKISEILVVNEAVEDFTSPYQNYHVTKAWQIV